MYNLLDIEIMVKSVWIIIELNHDSFMSSSYKLRIEFLQAVEPSNDIVLIDIIKLPFPFAPGVLLKIFLFKCLTYVCILPSTLQCSVPYSPMILP